eukprot:3635671-Amphidinium_carterae.1
MSVPLAETLTDTVGTRPSSGCHTSMRSIVFCELLCTPGSAQKRRKAQAMSSSVLRPEESSSMRTEVLIEIILDILPGGNS